MDFKIKAKQDFIFFGVSFIKEWLSEEEGLQFQWFVHDGDVVLKNQTCCMVHCEKQNFHLDKLLDFLCYLSGGTTLVRCFVNSSSVPVVASSTEHSILGKKEKEAPSIHSLAYWEEESVKAGGGQLEPRIPKKIFQNKEMILKNLKNVKKFFCFNEDSLNTSEIESLITELPEDVTKGIYGSFRPEHCKAFSSSTFQVLWPGLLQGYFPRVQMIKCSE